MQYYKFSDERNKKYSIKTTIVEKNNERFVEKAPIFPEGMEHIQNIYSYHDMLQKAYPQIKICPVEMKDDKLIFDYVEGNLMIEEYQKCMDLDDKAAFFDLIEKHYQIICGDKNNIGTFEESEESKKWFGNMKSFNGKSCLRISNFDATPSNIVLGDDISFIDYEWVFDCGIPKDLAVYHCIGDAYLHIENLEKFVPLQEAMHILRVFTPVEEMREYYQKFYKHVLHEQDSICFAEKKFECLKEMKKISDIQDELKHAHEEWEKTAKYWQGSCEENDRLNKRIQELETEKANLNSQIEQSCSENAQLRLENSNQNVRISELLHENAKLAQYWKDSCSKYREPVLNQKNEDRIMWEKREKTMQEDFGRIMQEKAALEQSLSDKDTHIRNVEAMLDESRNEYNQIVNSKRWRIVAKIARMFHR